MKKILKKETAVTLIALIITIIVLLILAGVAFNSLLGNNGLLNGASDAGEVSRKAAKNELDTLNQIENEMEKYASAEIVPPSIRSNNSKWKWRNKCYNDWRLWSNRNSMVR